MGSIAHLEGIYRVPRISTFLKFGTPLNDNSLLSRQWHLSAGRYATPHYQSYTGILIYKGLYGGAGSVMIKALNEKTGPYMLL